MADVAHLFGARAGLYANFRPPYPPALFNWLAANSPARSVALDLACGNGQASLPLRQHFSRVLACDSSLAQLQAMPAQHDLELFVADARALPLRADCLDLILVAQALHWFASPAFFVQIASLLKPDGLFCAWCYGLLRIDPALDAVLDTFYHETLGPYWPAGRRSVDCGYRDLDAPFTQLDVPAFCIEQTWDLAHLLGYLSTWSAVQLWEQAHGRNPITLIAPALQSAWGNTQESRIVRWPLHFLAGYPLAARTLDTRQETR